ncbi:hypothetical protein DFR70_10784 [Nocardia tenerifensis]|uniref:Uncharacterized protein n=1 Tax=Nocardia tenerifensis TaxID=228006 RepID=A0A318JX78_9NOCA|nr:hypothetical protein DFR70_10784 [Nocardia tenerifensis]
MRNFACLTLRTPHPHSPGANRSRASRDLDLAAHVVPRTQNACAPLHFDPCAAPHPPSPPETPRPTPAHESARPATRLRKPNCRTELRRLNLPCHVRRRPLRNADASRSAQDIPFQAHWVGSRREHFDGPPELPSCTDTFMLAAPDRPALRAIVSTQAGSTRYGDTFRRCKHPRGVSDGCATTPPTPRETTKYATPEMRRSSVADSYRSRRSSSNAR